MNLGLIPSRHPRGFTLIELLVVMAILAILASIAYPSYRDHVLRGQLVDATSGLAAMRADMERFFQDNRSYASTGAFTTPCAAGTDASRQVGSFALSCNGTPDATSFSIQAQGSGSTAGFAYAVDQSNQRATTAVPAASGWATCASAWIVKRGQAC